MWLRGLLAMMFMALWSPVWAQPAGNWLVDQSTKCKLWWPNEATSPNESYAYSAVRWTGSCKNGMAAGHGTFEFAVTWRYSDRAPVSSAQSGEGDFVAGKFTGKGFTSRRNSKSGHVSRREGEFRDGFLNGRGIEVSESAESFDRFEGEYRDGKRNGWGVDNNEEWKSSTRDHAYFFRYEGEYRDGEENGRGVYVRGRKGCHYQIKYEGEYRDGRMNGRGTMTTKDGRPHSGMFENGNLVGTSIGIFELVADIDQSCP